MFLVALIASGGVFLWQYSLEQQLATHQETLDRNKEFLKITSIEVYAKLDAQIDTAKSLLDSHISPSFVFDFLQASTLSSVRFVGLKLSKSSDAKDGAGRLTMNLSGEAPSFEAVALQSDEFASSKFISNPIFSGIAVNDEGMVTFAVSAEVNAIEILYSKKFNVAEASDPSATEGESDLIDETVMTDESTTAEEDFTDTAI